MPPPSRVVIAFSKAESDKRAAGSLAAGFSRDGLEVVQATASAEVLALLEQAPAPGLIVASLHLDHGADEGLALARAVRDRRHDGLPIILVGEKEKRPAAAAAGATAFVPKPAYVKDIITLAHIFWLPRDGAHPGWGGELGPLHLYYMVRALDAMQLTGSLSLLRGGRRGELRFFEGEVTSAQVGVLHGQAALHQLLLWPEATFDLRLESIVRRQQIPLTPAELLQDAERFLRDFNEMAGGMSPASVYEQDLRKAAEHIDKIPKEVTPILRMFDGARSVADIIEESPLRMPETLKVVQNLASLGAIRKLGAPRPHVDAGTVLLIEDWLVGQAPAGASPAPGGDPRPKAASDENAPAGDWGKLDAYESSASYAPVVPSQSAKGEISAPTPPPAPPPVPAEAAKGGNGRAEAPKKGKKGKKSAADAIKPPPPPAEEAVATLAAGSDLPAAAPAAVGPSTAQAAEAPITEPMPKAEEPPSAALTKPPRERSVSGVLEAATAPFVKEDATSSSAVVVANDMGAVVFDTPARPPAPPPVAKSSRRSGGHAAIPQRFEAHEEEFFKQEEDFAKAEAPAAESFDDLDADQAQKPSFWQRIFRKKRAAKK